MNRNVYRSLGRSFVLLAVLLALLGTSSGCFFSEAVNEAPVPGIRTLTSGPYFLGDVLRFDATKTVDDVRTGLMTSWQARTCNDVDTPRCQPLGETVRGPVEQVFSVSITSHDRIEIQLRVTDELGASRRQPALLSIDVSNAVPSIDLQVSGHRERASGAFILYRSIDLVLTPGPIAGDGSGASRYDPDGDEVALTWRLLPPLNSREVDREFVPVAGQGYKLVPDASGDWSVIVSADDGYGGVDEVQRNFFVGVDQPPCLQALDPEAVDVGDYLVDSREGARSFSVLSVSDALDPFPASLSDDPALGQASFRWWLRRPGDFSFNLIVGQESGAYLIDPLVYQPGDRLELRVEVRDRVGGMLRELGCDGESRSCELLTGSDCFQRKTWGIQIR